MVSDKPSVDSIFLAAIELHPDQRPAYLNEACGNDPELRSRVERLLDAQSHGASFLESPAPELGVIVDGSGVEQPGTEIGPYKLLQQIGEGGFGVVFLAEQSAPVRRKVAFKVIKPGMDTRQVIARFEAERQVLALMDHPNIAKIYDAGMVGAASRALDATPQDASESPARLAGPTGRPYFVMELVQGVPITQYCDQCSLTTRERLELFITVCQAVQHAHQKGIIHRDIKPTNVLVALQDGRPTPKIIDFGVAKAIGERLTEHTLTTAFAQMIGSPLYMSPEQAELSPLGVDTRSDIYSLGVMLYELLAGTTPFDQDRLRSVNYDELRRIIREEEPPRPSARISTLAADLATTVADQRRTDVRRLRQTIRSELDWIVMKAIDKDRNRRYETPSSLARDIERYLHDEPVQACPPSAGYRFRKFARRNKMPLAAGGAIVATLLVGLGLFTWIYLRAATERARAQAVSGLLNEVFARSDDDSEIEEVVRGLSRAINISDEQAAEFAGGPAAETELAISYAWLANFLATSNRGEEARVIVRRAGHHLAHAAKHRLAPAAHLKALWYLAMAKLRLGDEADYREACRALLNVPTDNDDDRQLVLWIWCLGPHPREDLGEQLKQAEELAAKHASNKFLGSYSAPWIDIGVVGGLLYRAGRYKQAEQRLEESLAAYPDDALRGFRTNLDGLLLLAMTKWHLGERDEARRLLANTKPAIEEWLRMPSNTWMRRAEIELLQREAETLIRADEANDAVNSESPISDEQEL